MTINQNKKVIKKLNKSEKKKLGGLAKLLQEAYLNVNHAGTLRLLINKAEKIISEMLE